MSRSYWVTMLCVMACLAGFAMAATALPANTGPEVFDKIDADAASGVLSAEEAVLYKFYYGFDQSQLPAEYRPSSFSPMKNATALIAEYLERQDELSPRTIEIIESFLARPREATQDRATYISPTGFFLLTYQTSGVDAVPLTDVNPANGIPDYVEKIAGYCDYSQDFECNILGFDTPPHSPYYYIYFESMDYYGYTSAVGLNGSNITLHNNFLGFPPNDDPEGNQWGAAKVTVAHEFKHASQRAGSRWSEGGWVEVDATWMEDIAYDYVNDYYNYLPYGSPISSPTTSLDSGGSGSYEDCVWQHWMSETWGNQMILDLWIWRKTHQSQAMLASYNQILINYGSSITIGWPIFTAWNYACGPIKAIPGFGYGEAANYPNSPNFQTFTTYPSVSTASVNYLATRFVRCRTFSTSPGTVNVTFDGQNGTQMALTAIVRKTDNTGVLERIPLDGNNDVANFALSVPRQLITEVGFSMSNGSTSGTAVTYTLTVGQADMVYQPAITLSDAFFEPEMIPNETASDVLTVSNTGDPGTTLHFDITVQDGGAWLAVAPLTGDVPQGSSLPVDLDYDTAGMAPGSYPASLVLTHNAPGSPTTVPVNLTVVVDPAALADGQAHGVFRIAGAYPNPFNPLTTIALTLPRESTVTVDVVDLNGRLVRTVWQGSLAAGPHSFPWDGRDDAGRMVAAGTYFARLHSAGQMSTTKMILAD